MVNYMSIGFYSRRGVTVQKNLFPQPKNVSFANF